MSNTPLKVFTDRDYLPEGLNHCLMLIPAWGDFHKHDGYAGLEREGNGILQLTAPDEAEVALLPFDGSHLLDQGRTPRNPRAMELAARFVDRARAEGLKTVVIVNSDVATAIPLPDVIVFRTSLDRTTRAPHEFALPAWHEDLVENHLSGRIMLRERPDLPIVGFCGLSATTSPPLKRRVKMFLRRLVRPIGIRIDHNDGIYLRWQAMDELSRCPAIRTQFITRSKYFGGALDEVQMMTRVRREYIDNLIDSDYSLCARGFGNFSFRFFESLSLGRIPVLIDTECVLPYDFLHDYKEFCVSVPEARITEVGQAVSEFHARLSPEAYLDLQRRVREFWVHWLSPVAFFRNLPLHWRGRTTSRIEHAILDPTSTPVGKI